VLPISCSQTRHQTLKTGNYAKITGWRRRHTAVACPHHVQCLRSSFTEGESLPPLLQGCPVWFEKLYQKHERYFNWEVGECNFVNLIMWKHTGSDRTRSVWLKTELQPTPVAVTSQYGCVINYANCNSRVGDKTQTPSICPIISINEDHQYSVTRWLVQITKCCMLLSVTAKNFLEQEKVL